MKSLISRLSMKRISCLFIDQVSNEEVFLYTDKYGDGYMANYPFYLWSFRCKRNLKHLKTRQGLNKAQENLNISGVIQPLLLLKGRIQSMRTDINTIDSETAQGRLKAMYSQVERLLDKLNNNVA